MFCTSTRSCASADDAKSCAVEMRNAILRNYLNWHQTQTAVERLSMRENVAVTTAASSCESEAKERGTYGMNCFRINYYYV